MVSGVKPFSIHPTVLNLTLSMPPSVTNIAKKAVDIIIPCTRPLSEREWDLLDEAVDALDESYSPGTSDQEKILICTWR
jgi:tetrahydromethanopterin S-methyltransferase subunit B